MAGRSSGMALSGRAGQGLNSLARRSSLDGLLPGSPASRLNAEPPVCELCKREPLRFTSHHLVPRSRGGKFGPRVKLCPTCHRQLHAMFPESPSAREWHPLEAPRPNAEFSDYLGCARTHKGQTSFQVRRETNRR